MRTSYRVSFAYVTYVLCVHLEIWGSETSCQRVLKVLADHRTLGLQGPGEVN